MSGMIRRGINKATPWTSAGWPKRVRDFEGLRARTKRDFSSRIMEVPIGTVVTIDHTNRARDIHIKTDPCPHCGVAVRMTRLEWSDLELIND